MGEAAAQPAHRQALVAAAGDAGVAPVSALAGAGQAILAAASITHVEVLLAGQAAWGGALQQGESGAGPQGVAGTRGRNAGVQCAAGQWQVSTGSCINAGMLIAGPAWG